MKAFYEKEIELGSCRLYVVANDTTATLTLEQIPVKYKVDLKVNVVTCHFSDWDSERLEFLCNDTYEAMQNGFEYTVRILKELSKNLFKEDYTVVCKEIDCFCIKPMVGYGFGIQGQRFTGFCTMDGLRVEDSEKSYSCSCPEEIKPIFRSICTGEIPSNFQGDMLSFVSQCQSIGCNVREETET